MKLYGHCVHIMNVNTNSMNDNQEKAAISEVLAGDHEQYRYLVERYHRGLIQHLYNLVYDGEMAEDIAQEAFIRAYEKLTQYNPDYAFSTWLYRIANNLAYRQLKQMKPAHDIDAMAEYIADDTPSAAEETDKHLAGQAVRSAIQQLPADYRHVISLYYWEDCSYEEIAARIDKPIGTVRTWLYRAKELLRKELYGQV